MKKPHTPTRVRITRTELATIRKRATSGPVRAQVDVLRLANKTLAKGGQTE